MSDSTDILSNYFNHVLFNSRCQRYWLCVSAQLKSSKATPRSHARGVVFEEVISIGLDEDDFLAEPNPTISLSMKDKYVYLTYFTLIHWLLSDRFVSVCRTPVWKPTQDVPSHHTDEDEEMEEKISKLLEMFPHLSRTEVLEVRLVPAVVVGSNWVKLQWLWL